jgi:hypothetical protein
MQRSIRGSHTYKAPAKKGDSAKPKKESHQEDSDEVVCRCRAKGDATPGEDCAGNVTRGADACEDDVAWNLTKEVSNELYNISRQLDSQGGQRTMIETAA